jgi:hypothetical protein
MKAITTTRFVALGAAALLSCGAFAAGNPGNGNGAGVNGIQGAVAATNSSCTMVNGNLFDSKDNVYVKPGPSNGGGTMLQNGSYYVQVTTPNGTVLGAGSGTTAVVLNGKINNANCVSLDSLVGGAYADTTNPGGEYKVWLSTTSNFGNSTSKTDNFKVASTPVDNTVYGSVTVVKFYDANVSGNYEDGEAALSWKVQLSELDPGTTPVVYGQLPLGDYTAREYEPLGNSVLHAYAWVATNAYQAPTPDWAYIGPSGGGGYLNKWQTTLTADQPDVTVSFGNVCIGPATGGRSIGYWTNKNGQNDMTHAGMSSVLANLGLLVDAKGHYFVPASYKDFQSWLKNATATNMAYMLSAQKVALKLAVLTGTLHLTDHVYAPGAPAEWGANPAGFIAIGDLLAFTETELSLNPYVRSGITLRAQQEALKNALENIDVNRASVAMPTPDPCGALAF